MTDQPLRLPQRVLAARRNWRGQLRLKPEYRLLAIGGSITAPERARMGRLASAAKRIFGVAR